MAVTALEPIFEQTPRSTVSGTAGSKDELGMSTFLTMLVAQLKNQDPLNPMEGTDFTAQLAQFSALDQQFKMTESLSAIQEMIDAQGNSNAVDYIGKTVKTYDNQIHMKDGQLDSSSYDLEAGAYMTFHVYDEEGEEIRKMYDGWQEAGEHDFVWDGKDDSGQTVGDGIYTIKVETEGEDGSPVACNAYVTGEVTGVTYINGLPYFMLGEKLVNIANVVEVTKTAAVDES